MTPWLTLSNLNQLTEIEKTSFTRPILLFKHSTRCSISATVKQRLERVVQLNDHGIDMYYLDLIQFRDVSNEIARKWNIQHESPQAILIRNGKIINYWSHFDIDFKEIVTYLEN